MSVFAKGKSSLNGTIFESIEDVKEKAEQIKKKVVEEHMEQWKIHSRRCLVVFRANSRKYNITDPYGVVLNAALKMNHPYFEKLKIHFDWPRRLLRKYLEVKTRHFEYLQYNFTYFH